MGARTLVLGEALIDIVRHVDGSEREHVGGSPLNVAVGLARLGHEVTLSTYIGRDPHGSTIEAHLAADRVPMTDISRTAARTSTATATLDENGSATYDFAIEWDIPPVTVSADHLHTGSIAAVMHPGASQVEAAMHAARAHATTVSYDPNARPTLMGDPHDVRAQMEQLIGLSDVVKASDEDIRWLYGEGTPLAEVLTLWGRLGPALVVATRGADGALVHVPAAADDVLPIEERSVGVIDTVGAGDSFMSGLLSGLLDAGLLGGPDARERLRRAGHADIRPALERAVETSAITVSRAGAQPPTRADLAATPT